MILKQLTLNPFAGIANRTYEFQSGLNVFLGRNEAGKSTMVKAILALLFIKPSKLVKDRNQFLCFLPVDGGDTIKAQLSFSVNEENYILDKSWGGTNICELRSPDGNLLTKYDEIEKKINKFLELKKLTYENVLIVNQSKLTSTVTDINESDVKSDLTQILRTSVFETGGVSIEKFKELINKKGTDYFNSWNRNTGKPKGNRDIENPWLKNVGIILGAYYKYRELETELQTIIDYELKIDEFNRIITELSSKRDELESFISKNKKSYEDNSKRGELESKIKINAITTKEITEVQKELPKIQSDIEHFNRELADIQEKLKKLTDERKVALDIEGKKHLAEKYLKLEKLNSELEDNKKLLKSLTKVTGDDVKKCNKLIQKIEGFKNKLEAQKLNVSLTAKEQVEGEITLGTDEPKPVTLQNGEEYADTAGGKFVFENKSLKIKVTSGNENVEEVISKLDKTNKELSEFLKSFNAENSDELSGFEEKYKSVQMLVNGNEHRIKDELEDFTLDNLKAIYDEVQNVKITKSSAEISDEITIKKERKSAIEEQVKMNDKKIKGYKEKYGSLDNLINKLVDLKTEENSLNEQIAGLSPMPEGFTEADEFKKYYEAKRDEFDNVKDDIRDSETAKAALEKEEPEYTQKEIREELEEAKRIFEKKVDEGEAIILIKSTVENILASLETDTYKPLKVSLKKYLKTSLSTENSDVKLEELSTKSLIRENKEIPVELLSTGTKDILGLALRLAMAEYYLKDRKGFMIMDDPLVNLDPERQSKAVSLIREFAKEKQILIMTCQPAHAALFSENIVNL